MKNRVYLSDGSEVVLVEKLKTGFLINDVMFDGDDEYVIDMPRFVEQVFDKAPSVKYDDKITALKNEISELNRTRDELKAQLQSIREDEKLRLQKYKQYEQLKRLDDFLDGKITHYVVLGWSGLEIIALDDAKSEYDKKDLRLLTLYGSSKGNLNWQLNQYKDGSGGSETVFPCTSYDEALAIAQKHTDLIVGMDNTPNAYTIKAAKKYNLKIDDGYVDKWKARERESLEKQIQEYKEKTEALKKKKAIPF